MLYLHTLGGLSIERDGRPLTGAVGQRGGLAILAALAATGSRRLSRDRIQSLFWPESDIEHARGALKQALFRLRRDAGEPDLFLGGSELQLNPAVIQTDVEEFARACDAGELERAAELYTGPFLDGIHLSQNAEFEAWSDRERDRLAQAYRTVLERLARSAEARGDWIAAVAWWRRLSVADPLSASAATGLMNALAASGDRPAALRHAREHEVVVREELGAPTDPRVAEVERRIREGALAAATRSPVPTTGERTGLPQAFARSEPHSPPPARRRVPSIAIGALALAVLALGFPALRRGLPATPARPRVLVRVSAPDSLHAVVLRRVADGIAETGLAGAVSDTAGADPQRSRFVVTLTATTTGDSLLLEARMVDAITGNPAGRTAVARGSLAAREATITALESRVKALLSARLDPGFESWSHAAAMPETYESLRELRLGITGFTRDMYPRHLPEVMARFRHSAALAPTSGVPLVWAAFAAAFWDQFALADSLLQELGGSGRRLEAWDLAMVDVVKAWIAGDLAAAHAADHRLLTVVPNSEWALVLAWDAWSVGRAREAVDVLRRLDPAKGWIAGSKVYWLTMDAATHLLGDHEAELAAARQLLGRRPDDRDVIQFEVKALAGLGRVREVEARCERAPALRIAGGSSDYQPCGQALIELWAHGYPEAARRMADRINAMGTAALENEKSLRELDEAYNLMLVRDYTGAERTLGTHRSEELENPEYVETMAMLAAERGDRTAVTEALGRLEDLMLRGLGETRPSRLSFRRAELAALLGDRDEAVSWITRAFREGLRVRTALHWDFAFDKMRDYPPFAALTRPVDDPDRIH